MQFQARPSPHTNVFGLLCTSFNRVVIQQIFRERLWCARPGAGCIKVNQAATDTALQSLRGAQRRRPPYVLRTLSLSCTDSLSLPSGKDTLGCGYFPFLGLPGHDVFEPPEGARNSDQSYPGLPASATPGNFTCDFFFFN